MVRGWWSIEHTFFRRTLLRSFRGKISLHTRRLQKAEQEKKDKEADKETEAQEDKKRKKDGSADKKRKKAKKVGNEVVVGNTRKDRRKSLKTRGLQKARQAKTTRERKEGQESRQ